MKPFLEVSFLRDDEVRNTTIPLFYDMMKTEFKYTADTEGYTLILTDGRKRGVLYLISCFVTDLTSNYHL